MPIPGSTLTALAAVLLTVSLSATPASPLHLDSPSDREAFRRWFTFLAESRYYATRPEPEIADCAGLVRWAFREALRPHDAAWSGSLDIPVLPALPPVIQFTYPRTPWGANLFRVDASHTAQFADATTLRLYNTTFVSRDIARARPGDLLFYAQFGHSMPAHVMIWLGPSQIAPDANDWVLYHTGPGGEIRKVQRRDLLAHPSPAWRPVDGNSNFLGVRRLNLLSDNPQ